jgi:bilin biosynthesis protein
MVPNSQRFDALFSWMDEQQAIELLLQDVSTLENPGVKYIAATRLGACSSRDSLDVLVVAATGDRDNIFDAITRRKSIEALGRRRDLSTLPTIYDAMRSRDEQTIVNAVSYQISWRLRSLCYGTGMVWFSKATLWSLILLHYSVCFLPLL